MLHNINEKPLRFDRLLNNIFQQYSVKHCKSPWDVKNCIEVQLVVTSIRARLKDWNFATSAFQKHILFNWMLPFVKLKQQTSEQIFSALAQLASALAASTSVLLHVGLWVGIITAVLLDFCLRVGIGSPGVISIIGWRSWGKSCKGERVRNFNNHFRMFIESHPTAGKELKSSKTTSLSIKLHKQSNSVWVSFALSLYRRS